MVNHTMNREEMMYAIAGGILLGIASSLMFLFFGTPLNTTNITKGILKLKISNQCPSFRPWFLQENYSHRRHRFQFSFPQNTLSWTCHQRMVLRWQEILEWTQPFVVDAKWTAGRHWVQFGWRVTFCSYRVWDSQIQPSIYFRLPLTISVGGLHL